MVDTTNLEADKRTLMIVLKTGIKRKELDPNREFPIKQKLSKGA